MTAINTDKLVGEALYSETATAKVPQLVGEVFLTTNSPIAVDSLVVEVLRTTGTSGVTTLYSDMVVMEVLASYPTGGPMVTIIM